LFNPTAPSYRPTLEAAEAAGARRGIRLHEVPVRGVDDFDAAFASLSRDRVAGFFVAASSLTRTYRMRLAELGLKHRLPSMYGTRENVEAGGLMSYAPYQSDLTRRAAAYIDKILKGAHPADLPVEQAATFQLVINLKTAKALGLEMPPTLLARADEVIE
jgi:putative ABC transport system substrate-binding protein